MYVGIMVINIPNGEVIVNFLDESGNKVSTFHSSGERLSQLIDKGVQSMFDKNGVGFISPVVHSHIEPTEE